MRWSLFFDPSDKVLALPSWHAPRLLMVSRSARQRWHDSDAFYPAFRLRARIVKIILRVLATCWPSGFAQRNGGASGMSTHRLASWLDRRAPSFKQSAIAYSLFPAYFVKKGVLPGVASLEPLEDDCGALVSVLREAFPDMARVVLLSGAAADPKQKLVAKVVDSEGNACGYLKFGEKPLARERIRREAGLLAVLPEGVGPRLLREQGDDSYRTIAITAIQGRPLPANLPREPRSLLSKTALLPFLHQLVRSDAWLEVDEHPAVRRIVLELPDDGAASIRAQVARISASALSILRSRQWPLVIQHGDLAPWNTVCNPAVFAIDWEEGALDGFAHFDLVYYVLQTAYFIHHWDAERTATYACEVVRQAMREDSGAIVSGTECAIVAMGAIDAWRATAHTGQFDSPLQNHRFAVAECVGRLLE
jgi:hypothetical protein